METLTPTLYKEYQSIREYLKQMGRVEGLREGRFEERREIVNRLYNKGYSLEEISEMLDIPIEQIISLIESS